MTEPVLKSRLRHLTLANQLTFLRLLAVPFFILAVLQARFDWALALFIAAGVTDLLDGLIARVFRQRTALGAYLDPAADKILLVAAFVLLTQYPSMFRDIPMTNRIPIWLTVLMISRDVFIVAVALMMYLAYKTTRFEPTVWGKITTVVEIVTIGAFLLGNALERTHAALDALVWLALLCVVGSGLHYLWRTVVRVRAEGADSHPQRP
jgi:cardiolipin synthase